MLRRIAGSEGFSAYLKPPPGDLISGEFCKYMQQPGASKRDAE
jgi:hypothetical protein